MSSASLLSKAYSSPIWKARDIPTSTNGSPRWMPSMVKVPWTAAAWCLRRTVHAATRSRDGAPEARDFRKGIEDRGCARGLDGERPLDAGLRGRHLWLPFIALQS